MTEALIALVNAILDAHAARAAQPRKDTNMIDAASPQPTTSQKVEDSIDEVAAVLDSLLTRFGHANVGAAIAAGDAMVPVFTALVDSIMGLFRHKQALAA